MKKLILSLTLLFLFTGCKHEHKPPSETLIKASEIQKEALTELNMLDKLLSKHPDESVAALKSKKDQLQNSMIEIEGLEHDHSQCDGDHSKKRFSIPDTDMLKVQTEWRDSIMALKAHIQSLSSDVRN